MKRSQVDSAIDDAIETLNGIQFRLPPFAFWSPEEWAGKGPECERVRINGLGWDVSDFGGEDFRSFGAVLFTLRNGNHQSPEMGTPYAEKVIVLKPGQRLPLHFHWLKTEDIINRGGGVLVMELYNATECDEPDTSGLVHVYCDGVETTLKPGELLELQPGESITLPPRLFHRFWASKNAGTLVCGEVSSVNDDSTDNLFAEPTSRFAEIDEDEPARHLLCSDRG
ncbi:MAG: D-lyxose/D-mannose family sugar isomerase [Armatimonadetes bacterium]|nr:D-lyxose/D-mannose family sugar isomerase [Armatimonadota bacterium]